MFELTRQVLVSDCDMARQLKPVALIELMGDCEQLQLDRNEVFQTYFKPNNFGIFLNFRQVDFLRNAEYSETLKAVTSPYDTSVSFGYRNTFVYDEKGVPIVKSYALGTYVDLALNKLIRVPEDIIVAFKTSQKQDMEYLPRKIFIPETGGRDLEQIRVPKSYIDFYQHVNNTKYVMLSLDLLPPDFPIKRIRVEYKSPAKLNDVICPTIYSIENKYIVILKSESGAVYSITEFS